MTLIPGWFEDLMKIPKGPADALASRVYPPITKRGVPGLAGALQLPLCGIQAGARSR